MDSVRAHAIAQYLRAAWRRRWMGVIVAWLVCGVGWVGVYTIPNQFESSARLFVDADAVLTPLLRGIAAEFGADHPAGNPAAHVAQPAQPGKAGLQDRPRPDAEQPVRPRTADHPARRPKSRSMPQTKNLFTITYRDKSPKLAHDVVQTLLTIFVESATGGSRTDMENARRFLERQIQSYEQQLRAAEKAARRLPRPLHRDLAGRQQPERSGAGRRRATRHRRSRAGCRMR